MSTTAPKRKTTTPAKRKPSTATRKKKKSEFLGLTYDILVRIAATFVASALAVIGAGSIVGIDVWLSATLGGLLAVARVVEKLSLALLDDGKITRKEVNAIFSQVVRLKDVGEDNAPKSKK